MTIIQEYLKLTKELIDNYGKKSLVLMQVGSFFECYALLEKDGSYKGSLIKEFAEINDMTISKKNMCVGHNNVVMAGFGLPQLEKYIKKLQDNGFTVAVYTQDSPSKNTTRSLSCIYSPGTYFSQDSQEISNNITCIWIHYSKKNQICPEQITIGISNIDILTGKTNIFEFSNEYQLTPGIYDYLEKFLSVYNPKESIIISNLSDDEIKTIISFINLNSIQIHKIFLNESNSSTMIEEARKCEQQKYQNLILNKYFNNELFSMEDYFYSCIACQSLCFLLNFVEKHNPYLVEKIDIPKREEYNDKLILANHSLKQLNIISDQRFTGKLSSIKDFLNNCVSIMGKREFDYMLLNPITNSDLLNKQYEITQYIIDNKKWEFLRSQLTSIRDIEKIKRKIIMNKFSPKDLNILYNNILVLKNIYKDLKKDKYLLNFFEQKLNKDFEKQTKIYEDFIKKHFILNKINNIDDLSPERLNNFSLDNICFINKSINNELDSKIKNCIDSREQFEALREYFSEIIKQFEKTSKTVKTNDFVKIHETPKMDPMLIGTKRRISLLKNMISKNIESNIDITYTSKYSNNIETFKLDVSSIDFKPHGGNQSNSIIISEQINKLSHTIQNAKDVLITNIITVYKEIISNFRKLILDDKNNDEFLFINNLISLAKECDILQCKAYLATKYNYCKPEIVESDESFVEVEKIRHCLIEQLNNQELYVTNDFDLGITQKGILLYGTNAVGKTSFIKSIGIAIIMAQAGLFVPASKFRYNPYNYLFTRILGNDNIFKGLSTFAVEMCELRTILKFAQKNSLILGDELCSGTESSSALSIFTAGLEKLHRLQSSFIFATHFHEIINYTEIKNLENLRLYHMSVIYDFKNKCLIYDRKLKSGPGNNMYGLEVCKSLNLPEEFLERAHELRIKYSNQLSILDQDGCKYNKNKIKNMCEICKKQKGTEIHHLQHQKNSINGYINNEFRLNHPANLINICEECHNKIHKNNLEHKVTKTTNGYTIQEI